MKEILLVEGNAALLASRQRTLEVEGYQVTSASTAREAASIIQHGPCDLIVADAEVPAMLEVLSRTLVPALIMIDEEKVDAVARELPMGLWSLLIKPFTAARLRQAVAEAIEQANAVKDAMQQRILLPLNNTSKLLVSEAEMDRFFKHVLEMTAAETEADGASVLILDEKTSQLTVKAELGLQADSGEACIRLGEWVMKKEKSLVVNEKRETDSHVKQMMSNLGAQSLLSVPLLTRERAVGVIIAFKVSKEARFTPTSLEFLSILAKQAAAATENANLFKSVEKQRQELERLLESAIQSQENERKRVAVEIHDGIGQQLVGILYRIQAFSILLTQQKIVEAGVEAEEIRQLLEKTVGELRRVLSGLRPYCLDELGLVSALRQEVERFSRETDTVCRFTSDDLLVELTSSQEAAIYRIVQEALVNIKKHAHANETRVALSYKPEAVSVTISDNGKGFKLDQANNSVPMGHMGLAGMEERAEMLGGNLSINSSPGNGTLVVLTIPLKK